MHSAFRRKCIGTDYFLLGIHVDRHASLSENLMSKIAKTVLFIICFALTHMANASENNSDRFTVSNLSVESECSAIDPGTRNATFSWTLNNSAASIHIDVTQYYNGWKNQKFETIAKLKGNETSFQWSGGDPGGEYSWRVRTMVNGKWRVSETASYQVPVCPVDFVERNDQKPNNDKPDQKQ